MESMPKNGILELRPDTIMSLRQEFNLDKPGRMEEAIRILREWIEKQPHFKKKDFCDGYLEFTIIGCKGSLERAKKNMDRACTIRTLLPQFFGVRNTKTDFKVFLEAITPVVLPKLTPDHCRVFIVKATSDTQKIQNYMDYFRFNIITAEYIKTRDQTRGFYIILDGSEADIMDILSKSNPVELRQGISIMTEVFNMRIKGIHLFTSSRLVEASIAIIKKVVTPKVGERIYSHKSLDALLDIVPAEILPKEYGGKERPLAELSKKWIDVLSTEEHIEYLKEMNEAGIDESYRQGNDFNEQYAGLPGTFRLLNVD